MRSERAAAFLRTRGYNVKNFAGFGGTFCVVEEAVSVKMGKDRIIDHEKHNVQVCKYVDVQMGCKII